MTAKGHVMVRRPSRLFNRHEIGQKLVLYIGITVLLMFLIYVHFREARNPFRTTHFHDVQIRGIVRSNMGLHEVFAMRVLASKEEGPNAREDDSNETETLNSDYVYYNDPADYNDTNLNITTSEYSQTTPPVINEEYDNLGSTNLNDETEKFIENVVSRLTVLALYTGSLAEKHKHLTAFNGTDGNKSVLKRIQQLDAEVQACAEEGKTVMLSNEIALATKLKMVTDLSTKCDNVLEVLHGIDEVKRDLGDTDNFEEYD